MEEAAEEEEEIQPRSSVCSQHPPRLLVHRRRPRVPAPEASGLGLEAVVHAPRARPIAKARNQAEEAFGKTSILSGITLGQVTIVTVDDAGPHQSPGRVVPPIAIAAE